MPGVGFKLTLKAAKGNFFDRAKVQNAMDSATRKALSRFGAFVRQRAMHSIRKRKGTSKPGFPPFSHVGLLRKLIFFSYDPTRKSVVIGPVLLRPDSRVPSLLEYGGLGRRIDKQGKAKGAYWRARPYMRPAFQTELRNMAKHWKNTWQKG